jgi:N utilization substance protein A
MDNKDLLMIADAVSKEKGLSKEEVLDALADGMETGLRKNFPEGAVLSVNINHKNGEITAYRTFEIVSQIENVEAQMLASEIEDELVVDGYVYEPFEFNMDRQTFNITKQVALQKIKQSTRSHQIEKLLEQSISLFMGNVKVAKRDQVIVDCNGLDITLFRRHLLLKDNFKIGEKVFFTLDHEKNQYFGTRVSDEYLIEVFKREIFQIEDGDIEIVSVSRNPGFRSKVILRSLVSHLDPIRTCIGPKGIHIKNIQNLLGGESVDLLLYNESPVQLLISAFDPVNITNILVDEDTKTMDIAVNDDEISQAIGRGGKNIEVISKLIGWNINVISQTEWQNKDSINNHELLATFELGLDCDTEVAQILIDEGFSTLEEIAFIPRNEFEIEGFDDELIDSLRFNAADTLSNPVSKLKAEGIGKLIDLGFLQTEIDILYFNGVYNNEGIADLSTFELIDLLPELDEDKAKEIIMHARANEEKLQVTSTVEVA